MENERVGVIGLGYVGLPLLVALVEGGINTIGFDVDKGRIDELSGGTDRTSEIDQARLSNTSLKFTNDISQLTDRSFFIITVPTPIDSQRHPDLRPLRTACGLIGSILKKKSVVVLESTVYPGVTEEICGPILEDISNLTRGRHFTLGYSPERINPGDRERNIKNIVKIISAEDECTLDRMAMVYGSIIRAGLYRAPSIRVAEAAKVIENTQRDINIALMNELAIIFSRLGIRTKDVLEAAGTKWNFLPFSPGLVGGHCIGVDPYYLTAKAQAVGYHPEVILAGRRINDSMGRYVAASLVRLLIQGGFSVRGARVGIFGITFKENVSDIRNSRVPDIVAELREYGVDILIHDPLAIPEQALCEYGVVLDDIDKFTNLDAIILAVPHDLYLKDHLDIISSMRSGGIVMDVKSALDPKWVDRGVYWSL